MNIGFCIAFIAHVAVLFIPGYLLLRALGFDRVWSVCLAPLPSTGMLCVVGQLYATLGVHANPLLMLGPCVLFPGIALFLQLRRGAAGITLPKLPWVYPALYVLMGLLLGYYLYFSRIVSYETLIQSYDLTQAVNVIRTFANSGRFSSLGINYYLEEASSALKPFADASFYPASWHMVCALTVQLTGATVPLVVNASQYVSVALTFPLGICALLAILFDADPKALFFGALTCFACVYFPWEFLIFGPIFPNMAAFSATPAILALFIALSSDGRGMRELAPMVGAFVISGIGLGGLHPNAIFFSAVFLIPYCVMRVWELASAWKGSRTVSAAAAAGFIVFCAAVWYGCFRLPVFADIVWHRWGSFADEWQEIVNIATIGFLYGDWYEFAAQLPLAALIVLGASCAAHDPKRRWLVASYLFACFIAFVSATRDDDFKQLVAGFWYTDHIRLAGMCAITGIPLSTMALAWIHEQTCRVVRLYNGNRKPTHPRKIAAVCACIFLAVNFLPEFNLPGSYFDTILNEGLNDDIDIDLFLTYNEARRRAVGRKYHSVHTTFGDYHSAVLNKTISEVPFSPRERKFLNRVVDEVGTDALIINNPMDGSFLAYGYHNLNLYYRTFVWAKENPESTLIRTSLANIASDQSVRDLVNQLGAQYVLILSEYKSSGSFVNMRGDYSKTAFAGISSITPDTPGFELVMEEYELRLYRIVPEEELE